MWLTNFKDVPILPELSSTKTDQMDLYHSHWTWELYIGPNQVSNLLFLSSIWAVIRKVTLVNILELGEWVYERGRYNPVSIEMISNISTIFCSTPCLYSTFRYYSDFLFVLHKILISEIQRQIYSKYCQSF